MAHGDETKTVEREREKTAAPPSAAAVVQPRVWFVGFRYRVGQHGSSLGRFSWFGYQWRRWR
ncbi:hypothetical protein HanPSC8_Chr10g0438961 [Helianthus annuus]|nr:hypothetical protein HanPSC8_Chr10g0438961 [Helianthus annuus]